MVILPILTTSLYIHFLEWKRWCWFLEHIDFFPVPNWLVHLRCTQLLKTTMVKMPVLSSAYTASHQSLSWQQQLEKFTTALWLSQRMRRKALWYEKIFIGLTNNLLCSEQSSNWYFLHKESLNALDWIHLQLNHNASHTCNYYALWHLTSFIMTTCSAQVLSHVKEASYS